MMGHHSDDHHRPFPPPSDGGGPSCNSSRPNEVLGSNICQVDDKVAGATTTPVPEVATPSSATVGDKTFEPFDFDLSTTSATAFKSPAGGMAADLGYPFTWDQWKELERQAMIFKYMMASIPVPPALLLPIAQTISTSTNTNYSLGNNNGSVYNLKLGLSSSNNNREAAAAEPGRCKRTDGKKWRCSRDVAPHQKYCERHLNRGRPRSRKPVEVLVQQPLPNFDNTNIINKKTRFDNHNLLLPNPTPIVLHSTASSHGLVRSNTTVLQPNGIPLFLDRTDENLSHASSYKELSRGFDWSRQELNLNPYTDFTTSQSQFRQDFYDEPLNLSPYTDFGAPEPDPEPDLISLQRQNQMETRGGFIDAWSKNDSNSANKKLNSSVSSSHSNLWPSSLTLSMAMEAGNALDEEMGLGVGNSEDWEKNKIPPVSNWLSPVSYVGGSSATPGGPLAEMLRSNSMAAAAGSDSSPSEVFQRTTLLSDSSGCTSPSIGAVLPDMIMPFQWLN